MMNDEYWVMSDASLLLITQYSSLSLDFGEVA